MPSLPSSCSAALLDPTANALHESWWLPVEPRHRSEALCTSPLRVQLAFSQPCDLLSDVLLAAVHRRRRSLIVFSTLCVTHSRASRFTQHLPVMLRSVVVVVDAAVLVVHDVVVRLQRRQLARSRAANRRRSASICGCRCTRNHSA